MFTAKNHAEVNLSGNASKNESAMTKTVQPNQGSEENRTVADQLETQTGNE